MVPLPAESDQPQVVVVNGQSFTVAPSAVVGSFTTVPLPAAGSGFSGGSPTSVVVAGVPVVIDGTTQAVISGQTFAVGASAAPTTIVVNGQTISIGSGGVGFAATTLVSPGLSSTAIAGVSVGIGASRVVIQGTTFDIGPSAAPTTVVVNGQTISFGPSGAGFASTTLAPTGSNGDFTTTTIDGITLSIGPSQVVISGTTYDTNPSATPTTITVDDQTISIGPNGVGFASTTIPANGTATARRTSSSSSTTPSRTGTAASEEPTATNGASSSSTPGGWRVLGIIDQKACWQC